MLSRTLHRLLNRLAFVAALVVSVLGSGLAVLLAPSVAQAAILPACESHELTPTPPEWLAPTPTILPDACSSTVTGDMVAEDLGDVRVPAMCSESGASVVAPPRVLPIIDARLDAAPGCGGGEVQSAAIGADSNDAPAGPPTFALPSHALLGDGLLVLPAWSTLAPPFPADASVARAGVKHTIDHPPR